MLNNFKTPDWHTSPGVFFVFINDNASVESEFLKDSLSIIISPVDNPSHNTVFIRRKLFRIRQDKKLVFPVNLHTGLVIEVPLQLTIEESRNLLFNLDLLKESLNSFYIQLLPDLVNEFSFLLNHFRRVVIDEQLSESVDLRGFKVYKANLIDNSLHVDGSIVKLSEWNEYVWRKSQYIDFSLGNFLSRYKWIFTIIMLLAIVFYPKDIPREWVDVVNYKSSFSNIEVEYKYYNIKDYSQFRRIMRSYLFQNGFVFQSDKELDKAMIKIVKNHLINKHQKAFDWKNKKLKNALGEIVLPKINELTFITKKLKANDLQTYKRWSRMLNDSLAYPTDYYFDPNVVINAKKAKERNSQFDSNHRKHLGIDLAAKMDSRVHSPIAGRAIIGESERAGRFIAVADSNRIVFFAHCDKFLFLHGENVRQGDAVATVGLTGHTTGPHVHLGTGLIISNGWRQLGNVEFEYQNPLEWLNTLQGEKGE